MIDKQTKFQVIPSMHFPDFAQKHQIWPVSLKVTQKPRKLTDHDQNLFISEGGQDTSAHQISGLNFHGFSGKYPETAGRMGRRKGGRSTRNPDAPGDLKVEA